MVRHIFHNCAAQSISVLKSFIFKLMKYYNIIKKEKNVVV